MCNRNLKFRFTCRYQRLRYGSLVWVRRECIYFTHERRAVWDCALLQPRRSDISFVRCCTFTVQTDFINVINIPQKKQESQVKQRTCIKTDNVQENRHTTRVHMRRACTMAQRIIALSEMPQHAEDEPCERTKCRKRSLEFYV